MLRRSLGNAPHRRHAPQGDGLGGPEHLFRHHRPLEVEFLEKLPALPQFLHGGLVRPGDIGNGNETTPVLFVDGASSPRLQIFLQLGKCRVGLRSLLDIPVGLGPPDREPHLVPQIGEGPKLRHASHALPGSPRVVTPEGLFHLALLEVHVGVTLFPKQRSLGHHKTASFFYALQAPTVFSISFS